MAAHTYWRILVTASGSSVVTLEELQMYDSAGTYLTTGGTASASSYYAPEGLTPANAFDGNLGTMWASNNVPSGGAPEWLKYQFASPKDVAVMRIIRREDGFGMSQRPAAFKAQWSDDDSAWTDAGTFSPAWAAGVPALSFKTTTDPGYVCWRMLVLATQDGTAVRCAELQLRGTPGGADQIPSSGVPDVWRYFFGDAPDGIHTPDAAFDDNAFSHWRGVTPPTSMAVAHNKVINVVEILYQASDDSYTNSASSLKIQGSNDGAATWVDVGIVTPAAWTALSQTQVLSFVSSGRIKRHPGMEGGMQILTGGMRG